MGKDMSVGVLHNFSLKISAVFGLIFLLAFASGADARDSAGKNKSLQDFIPGLLLSPAEKTQLGDVDESNPFPSDKYSDIILDEDLLYDYYDQGEYGRAVFGLLRLARNEDPRATETVGLMYRLGQGLPKDQEQAARWLLRAAEKHRPLAQHHLGVMHYTGEGVRMDMLQSSMWLNLAAMNYIEEANQERALEDLRNVNLRLSSIEQTRSKELVRNFLRLHPLPEDQSTKNKPAVKNAAPKTEETATEDTELPAPDAVPDQP